jgi:hypothetical protein
MSKLPDILQSGEAARLIPVVADTSKENRSASILLAGMSAVDQLSKALLEGIGLRLGKRSVVTCYTEVVPKLKLEGSRLRPDGLVTVKIGSRTWSALIEAKIGKAILNLEQVEGYLQLAKLNGIDAVITVSNQFAALPTHHPLTVAKSLRRGVDLFHWSWKHVLTQATLVATEGNFQSEVQRFVLNEMIRYYDHDSVGVHGFDRMNPEWKDLVLMVRSGAPLSKAKAEVANSVAAWHQESRDLALIMSRKVGRNVVLRMPNSHKKDPLLRLKNDSEKLAKTATLDCELEIPDAASSLIVSVDLKRRVITCEMRVDAPKGKTTARSRIKWLLKQLVEAEPGEVFVSTVWPGRSTRTQCSLSEAIVDPVLLELGGNGLKPQAFEVQLVKDLAGKMSGQRTFIETIEITVPQFYHNVGERLRAWVAPPPKIVEQPNVETKFGLDPEPGLVSDLVVEQGQSLTGEHDLRENQQTLSSINSETGLAIGTEE